MTFAVGVRDSLMIAHSFTGEEFGPAQQTHGATYTIDAEWSAATLVPRVNWVLNIADASDALSAVVAEWNYRNLDEVRAFQTSGVLACLGPMGATVRIGGSRLTQGENTTTEFLSRAIHSALTERLPSFVGTLKVTLHESHKAWASYSADVPASSDA